MRQAAYLCVALATVFVLFPGASAYNYYYMEEDCHPTGTHINVTMEDFMNGNVQLVRSGGYSANLSCVVYIWAPTHYHFVIRFRRIDIYKPEKECTDVLYLAGNTTTHTYCGYGTPSYALISTANMIRLEFQSYDHSGMDEPNDRIGYELYYTAYHDGECDTDGHEFRCRRDNRCIPKELTCDERDNCGDWSDERASVCGLPAGSIVMITLICLLIGGTCIAACVYYVIETKNPRPSPRSRRQNNVTPAYTVDLHRGRMTSPMEPPPYSQAPPLYTVEDTKVAPPPSYDNLVYQSPPAHMGQTPVPDTESSAVAALSQSTLTLVAETLSTGGNHGNAPQSQAPHVTTGDDTQVSEELINTAAGAGSQDRS